MLTVCFNPNNNHIYLSSSLVTQHRKKDIKNTSTTKSNLQFRGLLKHIEKYTEI